MGTNLTILEGRLTRDVKFEKTPSGVPVASFTLAVQRNFKNKDGERETDFIRVVAYQKLADLFATYTRKGSHINVVGRLISRKYMTDGAERTITEVVAEQLSLLDSAKASKDAQIKKETTPAPQKPKVVQEVPLFQGQATQMNPEILPPEPPLYTGENPF